jgi:hypothetical protein
MESARRPMMNIRERQPGDLKQLNGHIRMEKNADRRDRLRAVVLAIKGEEAPTIARLPGRSRRQIHDWAYAFRDLGIDAIHPSKPPATLFKQETALLCPHCHRVGPAMPRPPDPARCERTTKQGLGAQSSPNAPEFAPLRPKNLDCLEGNRDSSNPIGVIFPCCTELHPAARSGTSPQTPKGYDASCSPVQPSAAPCCAAFRAFERRKKRRRRWNALFQDDVRIPPAGVPRERRGHAASWPGVAAATPAVAPAVAGSAPSPPGCPTCLPAAPVAAAAPSGRVARIGVVGATPPTARSKCASVVMR